jgi:hypothetical protein
MQLSSDVNYGAGPFFAGLSAAAHRADYFKSAAQSLRRPALNPSPR